MRPLLIAAILAGVLASHPRAQTNSASVGLVFDAVSIKPSESLRGSTFQFLPGGGLNVRSGTLRGLIESAYDVREEFQIVGASGWMNSERYDVIAKSGASDEQTTRNAQDNIAATRVRLQALLADRFELKIHRETRGLPGYALVQAKTGSKLVPDTTPAGQNTRDGIEALCGRMKGTRASSAQLASRLARVLNRSISDRTALSLKYTFSLEWTPDTGSCGPDSLTSSDGPSLVTALQEQLGLKLEPIRADVEVLVIDHAERPSPD
jgi:uncharacterized protein (TIGR03435 family)